MSRFTGHDLTCIRGERRVFRGLDFAIGTGGALVLSGPNGSGKSSLLRLMAGLQRPAAGAVSWDGEAVHRDPESHHQRLHYVGHLDAVKAVLTVGENVAFWAALGTPGGDPHGAADAALDAFGLRPLAAMPARFLSAGQRRRVSLARIIATPSSLWLLDEPTTALDAAAAAALAVVIARHRADGGMVVVATHTDMDLADAQVLDLAPFAGVAGEAGAGTRAGGRAGGGAGGGE